MEQFLKKWLTHIYYFAWMALAASIPLSQICTSVALFTIVGAWLLMGDFKYKAQQFKQHKIPFLLAIAVFLLFTAGLWNTENFAYAFKDLKIKLPILAIPILITSGPKLTSVQLKSVFYCLAFGAVLSAILGYVSGIFFSDVVSKDFRNYSPFISHIRLSLMLCFALALFYDSLIHLTSKYKWLLLLPFAFIIFYLNLIQSLTSLIVLLLMLVYLLVFYHPWKYSKLFGVTTAILFLGILIIGSLKTVKIYQDVNRMVTIPKILPLKTANGNSYYHKIGNLESENGYPVMYNICNVELNQEWAKVSKIDLDTIVKKYPLRSALIRYLTSRGLNKDSVGLSKLNKKEISAIEKGVANVYYLKNSGLENRLHQTFWEIKNWRMGSNSITNSVAIRLFFWQNAKEIIKDNFITGVGIGDVQDEINQEYQKGELAHEIRKLRSHNQYLTTFISHGVFGFLLFVVLICYPFICYKGEFKFLYIMSGIIILSSMLWEDTLETQAGANLAALLIYLPFLNRRE